MPRALTRLLTTIALIAATPAVHAEIAEVNLRDITDTILPTELLQGDREFGGNGPRMVLGTRLFPARDGRAIMAEVMFSATETGGDGSRTAIGPMYFEVWRSGPENGNRIVRDIVDQDLVLMRWTSRPGCSFGCGFVGPHEDGALIRRETGPVGTFVTNVTYLGDTAGDDISDDGNPHGDTSIRGIQLGQVTVDFAD